MSKKQILRKTFIFYGMDYSEYYLKNYKALREGIEGMNYNNAYYRYYNAERQMKYEPAVIYTQPAPKGAEEDKRADIEYDPNAYIAEEYYPVTVEKGKKGKARRRIWLVTLCVCLVALSCAATFLATDIITDGAVIGTIKSFATAKKSFVYVSYLTGCVDYESAKLQSEAMRSQGLGGYIGMRDGEYIVYADIAEREDSLIFDFDGAQLTGERLELDEPSADNYPEGIAESVVEYGNYTNIFLGYMFELAEEVQVGGVNSAKTACAEDAAAFEEYINGFISSASGFSSNALIRLTGDMRAEAAFLRTLAGGDYGSSGGFLADIRYYSVLAVINRNSNI